ncbi:hypothetical protein B0T25DRAFT_492773 [Lasiosphaeria hispida]|uniref:Protein kinase domain-containing protein n=1 Tax=Lasiosphaeria hispida TaxID=260671 RepID=A0AAJ0HVV6_9PEZI|nr:hypothetical protein B0T25DRAFT_492773 [Lasiosphaeria hispida]
MADNENARLRQALAESERRNVEYERRVKEAERRALDERRRREAAEKMMEPQTLAPYLDACHTFSLAIKVVTDHSLTTRGNTTDPTGRFYPRQIIPWDDFPARQEKIWEQLSDPSFLSQHTFPSQNQLKWVQSLIRPINCEERLRIFERDTVEIAVQKLIAAACENPLLRDSLGLRGVVMFQDQSCIHRTSGGGADIAVVAIKYKSPHELSQNEVVTGLTSKIQPDQDVINENGKGIAFTAKRLTTAIIIQLFSSMIDKNTQYGYVCTGQTFIFLHIPDNPTTVYYHICIPNLDVTDKDKNRLRHTAVAQVFTFILQALQAAPPLQSWYDLTTGLGIWPVEYEKKPDDEESNDKLAKTPPSACNKRKEPSASPYNPPHQGGIPRSPIHTRSHCKEPAWERIEDRPYCTHQCLLGLAFGGPMDKSCPNAATHGPKHIPAVEFRRLLRAQLATDRGADADCVTLYLSGAVGSLFKLRLSAHGYTLVAKGVQAEDMEKLQFENGIYNELRTIQGKHIPVCLGLIDLVLPYYYNGGKFRHFLFLSWGGQSLSRCMDQIKNKASAIDAVTSIFTGIHRLGVLHGDAEPRNILYDATKGTFMATDFGEAKHYRLQPLSSINPNTKGRKRKLGDRFERELSLVVDSVSRCLRAS